MSAVMEITKTEAIMDRLDSQNQDEERSVTFVMAWKDSGAVYRTLELSFADWQALGSPDQLTVKVTPGDGLNPKKKRK